MKTYVCGADAVVSFDYAKIEKRLIENLEWNGKYKNKPYGKNYDPKAFGQLHYNSAHNGQADPNCPACHDIAKTKEKLGL
jgi:hypothetical protein